MSERDELNPQPVAWRSRYTHRLWNGEEPPDQIEWEPLYSAAAESQLARALGEGAGLKERLAWALRQLVIDDDWLFALGKPMDQVRSEEYKAEVAKVKSALASTPLVERAGKVLRDAYALRDDYVPEEIAKEPMSTRMLCASVDALRAELQKGG